MALVSTPWFSALRDRVACWLCNAILRAIATKNYRDMLGGSISYGLNAAARDERANVYPPPPWWTHLTEDDYAVMREDAAE